MAIGVAILGGGIFAKERHLPAVLNTPAFELKAIYSRSLKTVKSIAEEAPESVKLYSDETSSENLGHLLKRDDIQAVIIALPIPVQPEVVKLALAAGKHVLAEKPIAKDIATAEDLVKYYKESSSKGTLAIAENFRYVESFLWAASEGAKLGRLLNFHVRVHSYVQQGWKYIETPWRKVPEYQGGFLLDGGVHFAAALRLMVGAAGTEANAPARVSAYTSQLQKHLPPIDTIDATWRTKGGVTGTWCSSFGTTMSGTEYAVAFEKGTVVLSRNSKGIATVKVTKTGGETESKDFDDVSNGVDQEVAAWAEGIEKGQLDPRQSPEEALKDLAMIESMIKSGESDGAPVVPTWV